MKKRLGIALVAGMMLVSLAGCGAKTEATDQEVPESSSVETGSDEITSTEVIGDDEEDTDNSGDIEENGIVLFAEKGAKDFDALNEIAFESYDGVINADAYIPLFDGNGYYVGEITMGATISVTEMSADWARFENPVAGTDYDYLYVNPLQVSNNNALKLTTTDVENLIKESIHRPYYDPVFTDVTDDMEVYEFRIPMYYENPEMDSPINRIYQYYDRAEISISSYKTYAVICTEDTDDYIICQLYYKDLITEDEYNSYN